MVLLRAEQRAPRLRLDDHPHRRSRDGRLGHSGSPHLWRGSDVMAARLVQTSRPGSGTSPRPWWNSRLVTFADIRRLRTRPRPGPSGPRRGLICANGHISVRRGQDLPDRLAAYTVSPSTPPPGCSPPAWRLPVEVNEDVEPPGQLTGDRRLPRLWGNRTARNLGVTRRCHVTQRAELGDVDRREVDVAGLLRAAVGRP